MPYVRLKEKKNKEITASNNLNTYTVWKEAKWGEDDLDIVNINDEDINFELFLPPLIDRPLCPSIKDVWHVIYSTIVYLWISLIYLMKEFNHHIFHPIDFFKICLKLAYSIYPIVSECFINLIPYKKSTERVFKNKNNLRSDELNKIQNTDKQEVEYMTELVQDIEDEFDYSDEDDQDNDEEDYEDFDADENDEDSKINQFIKRSKLNLIQKVIVFIVASIIGMISFIIFLITILISIFLPIQWIEAHFLSQFISHKAKLMKEIILKKTEILSNFSEMSSEIICDFEDSDQASSKKFNTLVNKWFNNGSFSCE